MNQFKEQKGRGGVFGRGGEEIPPPKKPDQPPPKKTNHPRRKKGRKDEKEKARLGS